MDAHNLIQMANRIGEFFEAMPEREQALHDVAEHIRKFWEPRMRRHLYAYLDGPRQGEGLTELVRAAALARRAALEPSV